MDHGLLYAKAQAERHRFTSSKVPQFRRESLWLKQPGANFAFMERIIASVKPGATAMIRTLPRVKRQPADLETGVGWLTLFAQRDELGFATSI
jgi:hypothetical protein